MVWYACYGSNLLSERFYCYLRGGKVDGLSKVECGCRDGSLPVDESMFVDDHRLFFADYFEKWDGKGCCFVDYSGDGGCGLRTFYKLYLITGEQFHDVVCQENNLSFDSVIDFCSVGVGCSEVIFPGSKYGRIICLGVKDDIPIYSFTSPLSYVEYKDRINEPSDAYLDCLKSGLKEAFLFNDTFVDKYFDKRICC